MFATKGLYFIFIMLCSKEKRSVSYWMIDGKEDDLCTNCYPKRKGLVCCDPSLSYNKGMVESHLSSRFNGQGGDCDVS